LENMGDKRTEADAYSYNIVFNALSSEGHIDAAGAMLEGMSEAGVHPDVTAYNTLLDAWIKSSSKDTSTRVARLYRWATGGEVYRANVFECDQSKVCLCVDWFKLFHTQEDIVGIKGDLNRKYAEASQGKCSHAKKEAPAIL
jgi:pentatricopeptide repeat protein